MKPIYRTSQILLRAFFRCFFGYRVGGVENIPRKGGVLLAVNHVAYADPAVAGAAVPRELHFFAKRELFRNPLLAGFIRAHNAHPVDRGAIERATLEEMILLLEGGEVLLVFPEGTRSLDGVIRDARPGLGMMAEAASVPVVPAYIRGTRRLGRSLLRRGSLAMFFGEPVLPGPDRGVSRKDRHRILGAEVMRRIRELQAKYG